MQQTESPRPPRPWYREPWPWLLAAGPAIVVVAGIVTAWIAIDTDDGLVVDDYYKQGLAINQELKRDERARTLGLAAQALLSDDLARVRVLLSAKPDATLPSALRLRLMHPTRAGNDQSVEMRGVGAGIYEAEIVPPPIGRWIVVIEDPANAWKLTGHLQLPEQRTLEVGAAAGVRGG